MSRRWVLFALLCAVAAAQEPVFRSNTRVVDVSLIATDSKGAPVLGLKAEELRVFDNKRPQTIIAFEASGVPALRGARVARRYEAVLLDALNTEFSDQVYARKAVESILDGMQPGDRIALFTLGSDLRLLLDFTGDAAVLRKSLATYKGELPQRGPAFPLRLRVLRTIDSMTAIARILAKAPGRKSLLWVSPGFPLVLGRRNGESFHDEAAEMARELSAAEVALYPVDARGLSGSRRATINIDSMREFAELTGGKAFFNTNDLGGSVRAAFEDGRERYALAYAPTDAKDDGRFHAIRVETTRKGVELRYRSSYLAGAPPAPPLIR